MRYAVGRWALERWDRDTNRIFVVVGRSTTDNSAVANDFVCNLWNPSGTISLWVTEFSYEQPGTSTGLTMPFCRTSTAGTTPTTTVTPDLDDDFEWEITPPTGAVLYLGPFATDPLQVLPYVARIKYSINSNNCALRLRWPGRGIRVPPGSGLGLSQNSSGGQGAADCGFRFWE